MKTKLAILNLTMISLLSGCTGTNPERYLTDRHASMIGQGQPSAYVDGYIDGCSSGRKAAGDNTFAYRKDDMRADKDALYAKGWHDGQIACRNEALLEQQQAAQGEGASPVVYDDINAERNRRVAAESKAADAELREIWDELRK